jgi:drug/metabolite transporter (DMT)-like permease
MNDGYVKVISASIIWGTIGVFARWSAADPLFLSFSRSFIAVLAILYFLFHKRESLPVPRGGELLLVGLSGIFRAAGLYFYFVAITMSTLCYTLFIFYLAPVIVVLLGPMFIGENLEKHSLLALFVAVSGVGLVLCSMFEGEITTSELSGIIHALLGALCFAFTITIAKGLPRVSGLALTFYQMLVATLCLLPFIPFHPVMKHDAKITALMVLSIVLLGVLHTAFTYVIYHEGLQVVKIQHAGIFLYLDPVVASIFGYIIFKESISTQGYVGAFLILVAGIMVTVGSTRDNTRNVRA